MLLAVLGSQGVAQPSEVTAGRASYREGEFQQAVTHFQRALRDSPEDAACHYWIGRSYETLADIAAPFGARYHRLALTYLTRATELAPGQPEYRLALFDFLLDGNFSRSEQRQAAAILLASAESDPGYDTLRLRFEDALKVNSSVNARLGRLFLAAPQAAFRVVTTVR